MLVKPYSEKICNLISGGKILHIMTVKQENNYEWSDNQVQCAFSLKRKRKKKREFNVLGVSMKNQVGNHVGIAKVVN